MIRLFVAESIAWAAIGAVLTARASLETVHVVFNAILDAGIVKCVAIFDTRADFRVADIFALLSENYYTIRSLF